MVAKIKNIAYLDNPIAPYVDPNKNKLAPEGTSLSIRMLMWSMIQQGMYPHKPFPIRRCLCCTHGHHSGTEVCRQPL